MVRSGDHPAVIAKLRSGYVTMAESQFLPGYCLLLADPAADPTADPSAGSIAGSITGPSEPAGATRPGDAGRCPEHLTDLPRPARTQFLTDLGLLGEALMAACAAWDPAFSRVDYEIVANRWRRLQGQVYPRYTWEPAELRDAAVWRHPADRWADPACALGPRHERLLETITRELSRVLAKAYN